MAVSFVSGRALFLDALDNSGVVYVTESGAMSPLDTEDPPQPDIVLFDTVLNSTIPVDLASLGVLGRCEVTGFEINLQGEGPTSCS